MAKSLELKDIQSWDLKMIDSKVDELRRELFKLRMKRGVANVEKPHLVGLWKKDIARLLTVKNNKKRDEKK